MDFNWFTSSGMVAVRINMVVTAIEAHLQMGPRFEFTYNHLEQKFKTENPRYLKEAYQLSPVKEWTASMTCCRAATG